MAYDRTGVPSRGEIQLRVIFLDATGEPVTPDAGTLELYIFDSNVSVAEVTAAVEADDFSAARVQVPGYGGEIVEIETGYFEYTFAVPSGGPGGTWHDVWVADIDSEMVSRVMTIEVLTGGSFEIQELHENQLVLVELDASIAAVAVPGQPQLTLGEDRLVSFSTRYSPYYASPDLLRLEAGTWLGGIPDDTLALLIHWSSIEADCMAGGRNCGPMLPMAKTKFAIYDSLVKLMMLPVGLGTGKTKRLGDLMISQNGSAFADIMKELKDQRREWLRVVNAGGCITPGQGLDPTFAVKGLRDPDRRRIGRLWWSHKEFPYAIPSQNEKFRRVPGGHRYRHGHDDGFTGFLPEGRILAPWNKK